MNNKTTNVPTAEELLSDIAKTISDFKAELRNLRDLRKIADSHIAKLSYRQLKLKGLMKEVQLSCKPERDKIKEKILSFEYVDRVQWDDRWGCAWVVLKEGWRFIDPLNNNDLNGSHCNYNCWEDALLGSQPDMVRQLYNNPVFDLFEADKSES